MHASSWNLRPGACTWGLDIWVLCRRQSLQAGVCSLQAEAFGHCAHLSADGICGRQGIGAVLVRELEGMWGQTAQCLTSSDLRQPAHGAETRPHLRRWGTLKRFTRRSKMACSDSE